ncbi:MULTISPECIES: hypothetical protein [Bacillus]|uniref:Integral membrane protein n=1 Tax=Bacillus cereus (strain ATCC 14579 / DSM 31 / CCUG 7414 / JCM 2152 / NBRC 15305 / NCIMB 9373 / NCTC 2599 / NRRL B-3711) TaxID=226900 RepID=Q81GE0_BACCR|nr:hypothetical protein [Bacillus cereus]AAP08250.1 Integral membrane protein [Bacillus cereus ATCC 14579]EEL12446.1 Integral membrane protein [Bacillus cereus BDRD-Cer4]MCC3286016.1 hypothetical protein [Bacillus cereus]MEB9995734.1 hypothetical protein [Bacillus cereus]OOR43423.1 hypothetical protein BW896_24315 [Bacillus cereus]
MDKSMLIYQTPIDEKEVKRFYNLNKIANSVSKIKWILALSTLLLVTCSYNVKISSHQTNFIITDYLIISLFLGWILNVLISFFNHFFAFLLVNRSYNFIQNPKQELKGVLLILVDRLLFTFYHKHFLYSPDYHFASYFKNRIKEFHKNPAIKLHKCEEYTYVSKKDKLCIHCWDSIKNANKFFIEFSNWINLTYTFLLVFLAFSFIFIQNDVAHLIFLFYLLFRTLSRSTEIIFAFYKDVVRVNFALFEDLSQKKTVESVIYIHKWRYSNLRKPARISLAVHSLMEMALTFSLLYFLVTKVFYEQMLQSPSIVNLISYSSLIHYDTMKNLLDFSTYFYNYFLYGVSMSFFNFSYTNYNLWIWNLLHVWQVIVSIVLIILSVASYLGLEDNMEKRDEEFFKQLEIQEDSSK